MPAAIPPFQAFLEENRDVVYRFLVSSTGPRDAEDLFQETFLAALRAYPKLRDGSSLRSWVLTIATLKVIDASRAARRRPLAMADAGVLEEAGGRPGSWAGSASDDGSLVDLNEPLWRAVRALPAKQRAALVHRVVLDRSYADVAAALGCSEQAARANVSEAIRALRERWNHAAAIR